MSSGLGSSQLSLDSIRQDDAGPSYEIGIFVENVTFSDDSVIELEDDSIVVFVGANNSGKSRALKEIYDLLAEDNGRGLVVKDMQIQRIGDTNALFKVLEPYRSTSTKRYNLEGSEYRHATENDILSEWTNDTRHIGRLASIFISRLRTKDRLADCSPVDSFDALNNSQGGHPIQSIYLDSDLEQRVSDLFRRAFNTDLIVHRAAGNKIPLFVGQRPPLEPGQNPVSRSYLTKIEQLDKLEEQGDGLKSFASLLLRVWTGRHTVMLLDEPEAFLHPPQARAVGELISAGADQEKQIFVATHSNDIIQGLLSKYPGRVSVVRIHRKSDASVFNILPKDKVAELWRDPILRYSNVLNGIFHTKVVVTESDGDCKFYEAIAESHFDILKSIFFTYAGGKDRIPVIVLALRALKVPVVSVVDIDIFIDDGPIRRLIESHGGSWNDYSAEIGKFRSVIQNRKGWLIGSGFKERVADVLKSIKDNAVVERIALDRIRASMREASPWESIKSAGLAAIPPGEPTVAMQKLISSLRLIGIYVVPEGEMEGFCRSVGGHGPKWVEQVMQRDLSSDPELASARDFVHAFTSDDYNNYPTYKYKPPSRFDKRKFFHHHSTFNLAFKSIRSASYTIIILIGALMLMIEAFMRINRQ